MKLSGKIGKTRVYKLIEIHQLQYDLIIITKMEFPLIGYDADTPTLMERVRVLQAETKTLLDILVDREMISDSADVVEIDKDGACPRPNGEECAICAYTYKKRIIINRADITKSIVCDKVLTCHSYEKGIYALIDVKPDCGKRGVVYYGSSKIVKGRGKQHMNLLSSNNNAKFKPVHKHFNEEHDGNDDDMEQNDDTDSINEDADKSLMDVSDDSDDDENLSQEQKNRLKYFRIAFIQEVNDVTRPDKVVLTGHKARLYVENGFMNSFATRGRFGFNKNESKAAYEKPDEPTTPAKKPRLGPSPSSSYNYNRVQGKRDPIARTVSEFLLVALAIRNHTTIRENPRREAHHATSQEITTFIKIYFKSDAVITTTLMGFLRANVDPDTKMKRFTKTNWFTGTKHEDQAKDKWVFGINTEPLDDSEETIEQAIEIETENGNLAEMLLDPTNLEQLCSGTLPITKRRLRLT